MKIQHIEFCRDTSSTGIALAIFGPYYCRNLGISFLSRERLIYRPIVSENLLSAMDILVNKMPMYQISFTSPGCEKVSKNLGTEFFR